jgi:hypothetical protein
MQAVSAVLPPCTGWLAVAVLLVLGRIFLPVLQINSAAEEKNTALLEFFFTF